MGPDAEDPVNPAGIEAEGTQLPLQCGDVIAPEHAVAEVQQTLAQNPASLDQGAPGLTSTCPVGPQTPVDLEGQDRAFGGLVVAADRVWRSIEPERLQAVLDITDSLTGAAWRER